MTAAERVVVRRKGALGHIELTRPEALNAIDLPMVRVIRAALESWRDDPSVRTVVISGAGGRAFCAGGDIRATWGEGAAFTPEQFLREEYDLNLAIARYPKPYVALMHGIVLGGGMGLSAHGSHRIVTESSRLGMPEVGIGFIPDVGISHLLARLPGELGTHLTLTGGQIGAADALWLGLADHFVPSERLAGLVAALESEDADAAIARFASPLEGPAPLADARGWIDRDYVADEVADILDRLRAAREPAAAQAAAAIAEKSPTALVLALRALREAREDADLEASLEREFRVGMRAFASAELAEGVRAQLIDRDRTPRWNPATLDGVSADLVAGYFAPVEPALFPQTSQG